MSLLRVLSARLHGLFRREAIIGDIDEEMRLHIEMQTEENLERGMPPAEARRAALRSFGNLDRLRDAGYGVRGGGFLETFVQDVWYGARVLARNKGFTAVAVLTLALGIGANTAIYSVVHQLLLRPLPYSGAERIVLLWEVSPEGRQYNTVSTANFWTWQEQGTSFASMAAFTDRRFNLTGDGGEPEEVATQYATPELLQTLGTQPILGRDMTPEDAQPNAPRVALLGHGFWKRRMGGDPGVVGKTILLNALPFTVIGILPADFHWHIRQGSSTGRPAEIWVPLPLPTEEPGIRGRFISVVARLKPGVTPEAAHAEMQTLAARTQADSPFNKGFGAQAVPLREQLVGNVRRALLVLLGAVAFVLLIACANVANLLLARAAAREKEIALRTALGARRMRIVRQLLTESLLLAVVGCALGLLLAWWSLRALVAITPPELFMLQGVSLNLPVLAVTVAVSLATGILFGLAPALEATRLSLNDSLKEGGKGSAGQGSRSRRLSSVLVITEVALAVVLLTSAGLLLKSFSRLQQVDIGFQTDNLLTLVVRLPAKKYGEIPQLVGFYRQAEERFRALPGVRDAGIVNYLPFYGGLGDATAFTVEGKPVPAPGEEFTTDVRVADAGYFRTLGIPLARGRLFTDLEDTETRSVVIINEALARQYFPGEDPIGKRITVEMSFEPVPAEIVGIVRDVKYDSLVKEARATVYMPLPDLYYSFMTIVLRTDGDPTLVAPAVRNVIREIDPDQPVSDVRTMNQVMAEFVGRDRFSTLLLGIFAGLATLLAAVGIYGVMSYSVTLRTREIGLRMALGAQMGEVLRHILKRGAVLAAIGIVLGLLGALGLTRLLSGLLFEVGSTDPMTFIAIVLLFAVVAWTACYIPARRATRVDPLIALRYD